MIAKAEMIPFRRTSFLLFGALAASFAAATAAGAGEADDVIMIGSRCSAFGPGVVELGNGMCARVNGSNNGYVRINPASQVGSAPRAMPASGWSNGTTSRAALRSDGFGMVPGAGEANHLRIGAGLDAYAR